MKYVLALMILIFTCAFGTNAKALMLVPNTDTNIEIENAYAFVTPKENTTAAIFFNVVNRGDKDRLIDFVLNSDIKTELHTMQVVNDVMKMRKVTGYDIGRLQILELKPTGNHIMVFNHGTDWNAGDAVNGTAVFENAGEIPVEIHIRARGEKSSHNHGDHFMHHGHGHH